MNIKLTYRENVHSHYDECPWVRHIAEAWSGSERIGYLKIGYIPRHRYEEVYPTFLSTYYLNKGLACQDWRDKTLEEKKRIAQTIRLQRVRVSHKLWTFDDFYGSEISDYSEDQIDALLEIADDPKYVKGKAKEVESFKGFHVDKPLVDYIRVDSSHQRKGIATRMYKYAAEKLMSYHGFYLHASGLQEPEAKAAWEKMEKLGWVRPSSEDESRRVLDLHALEEIA